MKLSDEQKISLVKEYESGISSIKLATKYGISKQGILSILKVRNVKIRNNK